MLRGCAEVAVSVHVALELAIDGGEERIATYIKLAVVDQQRLIEILLNDRSAIAVLG